MPSTRLKRQACGGGGRHWSTLARTPGVAPGGPPDSTSETAALRGPLSSCENCQRPGPTTQGGRAWPEATRGSRQSQSWPHSPRQVSQPGGPRICRGPFYQLAKALAQPQSEWRQEPPSIGEVYETACLGQGHHLQPPTSVRLKLPGLAETEVSSACLVGPE